VWLCINRKAFNIFFMNRTRFGEFRFNSSTELVIILRSHRLNRCLDKWDKLEFNSIYVPWYNRFTTAVYVYSTAKSLVGSEKEMMLLSRLYPHIYSFVTQYFLLCNVNYYEAGKVAQKNGVCHLNEAWILAFLYK
jgi:hypothetical protein